MAGKKKVDPIKQREKRAKIAAGIGVVFFLAVAAYEVPSVLKLMNQKPPPGANATDAGNRNPDGSIPLPSVATAASAVTANGQLADTDVPPPSDGAQLVAFSVFQTKNPFVPQVTATTAASTPAAGPTTANKPGADVPPQTTTTIAPGASAVPSTTGPTGTTGTTATPTTPAPPTVAISVNGVVSRVGAQGTFPTGSPVFRLVSFSGDTAQIGIVGGSYATGDAALTLHLGQSVTLENTTDQKTYTLKLIATH